MVFSKRTPLAVGDKMAFDNQTRNSLQRMVTRCRQLLAAEFTSQLQTIYGIQPDGMMADLNDMTHLDDDERVTAGLLRERIKHIESGPVSSANHSAEAIERLVREQAFTIINRFAAMRMAEERGIILESAANGMNSKGFKVYEETAGRSMGNTYERYRTFIYCLWDELAIDLGTLFDRFSPFGLLFPREKCLENLFELLNDPDIAQPWKEDETIGWIYQYFNAKEERDTMRKASRSPRDSRELAVRNQFFTPRYVVEFLTDNTLGRTWYEMTRGNTRLKDRCQYMVRRPNEIFLKEGESPPQREDTAREKTQEELLREPVYLPYRPMKDPREILMLDPACGSMHFGLYAFDLYEVIYEEAWDLHPQLLQDIRKKISSKEEFLRLVPGLIFRHNIHGIDIDPRAVQIANLSLWLRAQKSWKKQGLKPVQRPPITRSHVVCAEPMPGEKHMLEEFVQSLDPPLLGNLVRLIWEKMQLAGEAGALLKIEEEISSAIEAAKREWTDFKTDGVQQALFKEYSQPQQKEFKFPVFDVKEDFWEMAEKRVLGALEEFAESARAGESYQRRLFADDAARGFAFIDICRKKYDVVLMNPPFGDISLNSYKYLSIYEAHSNNILCPFIVRAYGLSNDHGLIGFIVDKTVAIKSSYSNFRDIILYGKYHIDTFVDLGWGVLDGAQVETVLMVLNSFYHDLPLFYKAIDNTSLANMIFDDSSKKLSSNTFIRRLKDFSAIPNQSISYDLAEDLWPLFQSIEKFEPDAGVARQGIGISDSWRWYRHRNEVPLEELCNSYFVLANGGGFSPFYRNLDLLIYWKDNGKAIKITEGEIYGSWSRTVKNISYYFKEGISFPKRTDFLNAHILPKGCIFTVEGLGFFPKNDASNIWLLVGLFNSQLYQYLINVYCGQHKHVGYIKSLPFGFSSSKRQQLKIHIQELSKEAFDIKKLWSTKSTNSVLFISTVTFSNICIENRLSMHETISNIKTRKTEATKMLDLIQNTIDQNVFELFDISEKTRIIILDETRNRQQLSPLQGTFDEADADDTFWIKDIIESCLGYFIGRWDIRIAKDSSLAPELPGPFDPLPVCPPGMLVGPDGLPAEPGGIVSEEWLRARPNAITLPPGGSVENPTIPDHDYPLRISWEGILVDDTANPIGQVHQEDILQRVREVLQLLWGEKAFEIEQEICAALKIKDLKTYLQKPTGFFQDHLKRYSKSRRQAPIYWPLSTASGSYTLWIYYHHLDDQTLYKCVMDFLNPKIEEVERMIDKKQTEMSESAKLVQRQELENDMDFLRELTDFKKELLRIAELPYKPNLNDGVLITAAPLYNLFRLPKWKKDLESCWKKLGKGDFDWSHLAYAIWPERVKEKCKKDKSIAIAHDLEGLFENSHLNKR